MHSDWSIEIFELKISQSTNQSSYTTFAKVVHECIDRETVWKTPTSKLYTISSNMLLLINKKVYEYILSGVGNSTYIIYFISKRLTCTYLLYLAKNVRWYENSVMREIKNRNFQKKVLVVIFQQPFHFHLYTATAEK